MSRSPSSVDLMIAPARLPRRGLLALGLLGLAPFAWRPAHALGEGEAAQGLRAALERGAGVAVDTLGRDGGYLNNPLVRIALPEGLQQAAQLMRTLGQGARVDALETAMNRAAEQAVPQAKSLLVGAVKSMSVNDALQVLQGGETAATEFFRERTRTPMGEKFLPIVTAATQQVSLAQKYNAIAGQAQKLGLLGEQHASIERYVTERALDGVYTMIAEEEKKIRQDPIGTGSRILRSVFGALK